MSCSLSLLPKKDLSITIEKCVYRRLKRANNLINDLMKIERLFRVFVASLREFEAYLLLSSLDSAIGWNDKPETMDDLYDSVFCDNVDFNYRVLSVLTAAGAYHDQRKAWLKGKEYREEIEKVFSIEYDKKLSYRIIEILRNHAKHQDLPIGNILYDSSNKYQHPRPEGVSRLRKAIEPRVVISELIKNGRLKSATRTEVGNIDKVYICLKSLLRNYAASMARGHEKVRQQTSDALTAAKNEIDAAHHRFRQEFPGEEKRSEYFLGATTTDVHGKEKVHIGKVFYRRLDRARAQFQGLKSFERFYVSSEMIDNPETYFCDVGEVLRD